MSLLTAYLSIGFLLTFLVGRETIARRFEFQPEPLKTYNLIWLYLVGSFIAPVLVPSEVFLRLFLPPYEQFVGARLRVPSWERWALWGLGTFTTLLWWIFLVMVVIAPEVTLRSEVSLAQVFAECLGFTILGWFLTWLARR